MRHFWLYFGLLASVNVSAAPFIAPAVPVGTVEVSLCPTEPVTLNVPQLVTFGVPFPRGSLTAAQLANLRVLRNGVEIAAFVDQMTPWRHRTNAALDGTSVRFARVQLNFAFTAAGCQPVTVSWGGPARTLNIPTLTPPRNGWHTVASGTFVVADAVEEPNVIAVLPKSWLAKGVIKGVQNTPFDDAVTPIRDNPATLDATEHWPGYIERDRAQKNNFYTIVNQDDAAVLEANKCHYKTDYEPWLYDRSATMYALYFRSGLGNSLREAIRASDFYLDKIDGTGHFSLKPGDTKYVYTENIAYTYWLTGDPTGLAKLSSMIAAQDGYNHVWQNDPDRFWTERGSGFKLLANAIAYELNGGAAQRDKVNALIAELVRHQDRAGGAIPQPAGFVDGGFYHYGSQHDYDWDEASFGASGWMTVLLVDAILRAYGTAEDLPSAHLIRRIGNFLSAATVDTVEHSYDTYDGPLALPRYGVLIDGTDGQRNYEDVEHALDVAAGLAWAAYFADLTGNSSVALRAKAADLYFTYDIGVNFWIRPAAGSQTNTAFRVSPWRKYGWEHRVAVGFDWALSSGGDSIFANGFQ